MRKLIFLSPYLLCLALNAREYSLDDCSTYLELELIDLSNQACSTYLESGESELLRKMGVAYLRGEPKALRDYDQAINYLSESIKAGNIGGFAYLGLIHLYGIEEMDIKDTEKALVWFELGTKYGCALCAANLGAIYFEDKHVPQNLEKAKEYFEMVENLQSVHQEMLNEIKRRTHNQSSNSAAVGAGS